MRSVLQEHVDETDSVVWLSWCFINHGILLQASCFLPHCFKFKAVILISRRINLEKIVSRDLAAPRRIKFQSHNF